MRTTMTALPCFALALIALAVPARLLHAADTLVPLTVEGDTIAQPLAGLPGDAARGRALMLAREPANCVLCHAIPDPDVPFFGNVGPPLAGVASRLSAGQIRLRIVDSARRDPQSVMPGYYRVDGLARVAAAWRGKPILTAQQVEDLVAYLATLR
jgi:sulfur-oxidizing protein SoxX